MNYCLFNLSFQTPVHFGNSMMAHSLDTSEMTCCADTLFSAMCHAAYSLGGSDKVEWLIQAVQEGQLRLSDCMPFCGDTYYLPRPCWLPQKRLEIQEKDRKVLKKAEWIPAEEMENCLGALRGDMDYDWTTAGNSSLFGTTEEITKATVPDKEDAVPYTVGLFRFQKDCGLYFILGYEKEEDREQIELLVEALGYSGIGGEISSGYGKFSIYDTALLNEPEDAFDNGTKWLYQALHTQKAANWMLVTASLPEETELENTLTDGCFQLIRRSGFTHPQGENHSLLKKQTQYFLKSGSVLKHTFQGSLYKVGTSREHPIYRYAYPLFLGVNL